MGGAGNDMIFGGAGDDVLHGDAGNDMLVGGADDDTYYGGAGSDTIYADADDSTINGWVMTPPANDDTTDNVDESTEAGSDPMAVDTVSYARVDNDDDQGVVRTLSNTAGGATISNVENIIGTQFVDTLTGDDGNNVIEGGDLGDTLVGGAGNDTVSYASSDDRVRVELADGGAAFSPSKGHARGDTVSGFENVTGSAFDDELEGNDEANVLKGGAGDDELVGDGDADTVEGGAGADEMDGGVSRSEANEAGDALSYASSDAGVTVNLTADNVSLSGGHADGDTIITIETDHDGDADRDDGEDPTDEVEVSTFENVTGSMHNDRLTGDYRDNHLTGGAGDDTLRGGASDAGDRATEEAIRGDVLVGGPGADVLDGGEDMGEKNNLLPLTDTNNDGTINDQDGAALAASVDWAVYKHAMEGVMVNLATNMGTGGEAMGDTLRNIELVWGSEKDDTFIAGPGADIIEGDGGSDTVSYEASEMGVTVDLSNDEHNRTAITTGDGTDTSPFVFIVDETPATATTHLDQDGVTAIPDPDDPETETNGAAGDKLGSIENVTGSAQKDVLTGDENPNILRGGAGDDTINGLGGNDPLLYGGSGEDTINGGDGNDKLVGCTGNDTLNGNAGDDELVGAGGSDDLSGGGGTNTFVFSPADGAGASDAILDWDDGTNNRIDLSAFELTREQVIGALDLRGAGDDAFLVINLTEFGGGRITINDIGDLAELDDAIDDPTTTDVNEATDDVIQMLSVFDADDNADGVFII